MNAIQHKQGYHRYLARPILFIGLLILCAGIYAYTQMQTNLFPEVLFPRITVIAEAGQQPVDRMMITVTKPLESAVKKVRGVTLVKSSTSRGSCVVDVYFKWGMDIYALKTQLESRINEIRGFLPAGTVISTEAMNQSVFPVYGFTLESKTHGPIALRDVGNLVVRPMFSRVSGISNVVVRGGKAKEFVVKPDPARLTALGLAPSDLKKAFEQTNFVLSGGNVAAANRLYLTLTDTRLGSIDDLRNVIVRGSGARIIRLSDVAGITINIMSLGAMAASVGLIIDDAIVIIEQIYREHEERPGADRFTVVRHAIRMLFPAMVASSLSTIVIHFPFRLMSGLAGSFFKELSDTMQLTLVASFLVTWLLLPVLHLVIGYKPKLRPRSLDAVALEDKAIHRVSFLTRVYRRPYLAVAFVLLLIGGGWFALTQLKSGFLPDLDEGTIVLDYHSPAGTDIEETDRLCRQMERIIMAHPDVKDYSRRTAMGMSFKTQPANYGDYLIELKTDRRHSTPEVISDLRRQLSAAVPLMTIDFGQRISDLLGDLMSTPQPIEVKIFGDDYKTLQQLAARTEQVMKQTPGVVDIDNGLVPAGASLVFTPHNDRLAQLGISETDFQEQLTAQTGGVPLCQPAGVIEPDPSQAAMTGGLQIGSVQDGEQMRRILLRFTDFDHLTPEGLRQCPIYLPGGQTRPLSYFCDVNVVPGEIEQRREDLKSDIALTARLDGRDLGTTMADLRQRIDAKLHLPPGYSISYGGAYAQQQQSFAEMLTILSLAVVLVLAVLMFLFRKWAISFGVLILSVLGVGGSLLALWLTGVPLNVSSYTGMIMVVGIIAENAIFTVWQYRTNRLAGGTPAEAIDYAIALRIRPKLMTAIGAVLALMPLALGIGLGAQMQQPLAVAVIGGFVVGLPLLLIVLPAMMRAIFCHEATVSVQKV